MTVDSNLVASIRLAVSFLIFLPFLRLSKISVKLRWQLMAVGGMQYGLMYAAYIFSFHFLQAYQVALFTIFTPVYVTLINDALNNRFNGLYLATALTSVLGTAIIIYSNVAIMDAIYGFFLVQLSNVAFAAGQIFYKRIMDKHPHVKNHSVFSLLYLGAVLITTFLYISNANFKHIHINSTQIITLIYLGVVASGLGFYWWNVGARRVNAGTLAVFNNLKIPSAVLVSVVFFSERTDILRLISGSAIVLASLFLTEKYGHKRLR